MATTYRGCLSSHKQHPSSVPETGDSQSQGCFIPVFLSFADQYLSSCRPETTAAVSASHQPCLNSQSLTIVSQKNYISRFQWPLNFPCADSNMLIKMSPAFSRALQHEVVLLYSKGNRSGVLGTVDVGGVCGCSDQIINASGSIKSRNC